MSLNFSVPDCTPRDHLSAPLTSRASAGTTQSNNIYDCNDSIIAILQSRFSHESNFEAVQDYERADYALYHAKARLRGKPVIFSREHEIEIRKISTIEHTLRQIDLDAELSLHYQPIVNVATTRLVGFEALARWHNPELGDVPPDIFISVAERTELIGTITQVLLRKALAAASSWPEDIFLSFNLSMRDLVSQVTILQIVALIERSGIDPRRIIIEVTETALMQDYEQVQASLGRSGWSPSTTNISSAASCSRPWARGRLLRIVAVPVFLKTYIDRLTLSFTGICATRRLHRPNCRKDQRELHQLPRAGAEFDAQGSEDNTSLASSRTK